MKSFLSTLLLMATLLLHSNAWTFDFGNINSISRPYSDSNTSRSYSDFMVAYAGGHYGVFFFNPTTTGNFPEPYVSRSTEHSGGSYGYFIPSYTGYTAYYFCSGFFLGDLTGCSFAGEAPPVGNMGFYAYDSTVYSTVDVYGSYFCNNYANICYTSQYMAANISPPNRLTITIEPLDGGNVTGDGISCNVDSSSICQYTISPDTHVSLTANANCGWAFGSWDNGTAITDNPYIFNMPTGSQTLYAKFFRIFRNAVGNFYNTSGTYGDGECVTYVKHETGITTLSGQAFSGDAYTYYQKAVDNGFATGSTPRIGAIIVFDQVPGTRLEYGHVGVVTAINGTNVTIEDQNWVQVNDIGVISQHTVDVSQYSIKGYIYYTP